jgi:hypothetical protein
VGRDSDEFAYRVGGGSFLLLEHLEEGMFADPEIVRQFKRIGLESGCAIYNRHLGGAVARYEQQFRPVLVGAIRREVPPDILLGSQPLAWELGPILTRKRRIMAEVERTGSPLFSEARGDLRAAFLGEAAGVPAADAVNALGVFADWDLENSLARETACMLLRAGKPEHLMARKMPFDGFFRRGGSR